MRQLRGLILLSFLLAACGGAQMDPAKIVYTQTNLRFRGREATSVNEWRGRTILPVCTPAQVTRARGREIRFLVNGERHSYVIHRSSRVPVDAEVNRLFGMGCPDLAAMSPADQAGIQQGRPYIGMSKAGVVIALGYPPDSRTPSLDQSPWTYWGEHGNVQVHFQGDVVMSVQGAPTEPAVQTQNTQFAAATTTGTTGTTTGGGAGSVTTMTVNDSHGTPVEVPVEEVGRGCDAARPCHPALQCVPAPQGGGSVCQGH
jgi:hypothetical protein